MNILTALATALTLSASTPDSVMKTERTEQTELATLGGGCFWCLEAFFESVDGVVSVTSGYAGGHVPNPTYKEVCSGTTGHAEVCQIQFDPRKTSFEQLLRLFWAAHDPTTLNRQGADIGTQYRSVIFCHNDAQRQTAEQSKAAIAKTLRRTVVTQILPAPVFYPAEAYHQDYYRNNPANAYCRTVIRPKLEKLGKP